MTLRTRIAAVASVSVALAVLAAAIGMYVAVRADLLGEINSDLRSRALALVGPIAAGSNAPTGAGGPAVSGPGGSGSGYPQSGTSVPPLGAGPPITRSAGGDAADGGKHGSFPGRVEPAPFGGASGYVQFISSQGRVFVPGGQGTAPTRIAPSAHDRKIAAAGSGLSLTDRTVRGTKLRVLTLGTGAAGAVLVAQPLTEVGHELSRLLVILALIGIGGVLLAGLLGTLVARTALTPIARFTQRTESLTGSFDLSRRLEVGGRDELARLAASFNDTLDALERSVHAQRHLIADASHELRTPISSLRANIQILGEADRLAPAEQQSLRADIVAELDELTALVGDVVELARGATRDGTPEDVRLDQVVERALETARRRGEVHFEVGLQSTMVLGQADRIGRAVSNLIDNARKWSPPGGVVEVALDDGVLSVRDHGPGFQEDDLPFVFDRFYRADDARKLPGSGLGLAIVRQAAEACGGMAEAQNAVGGGALLRVSFGAPVPFDAAGDTAG